MRSIVSSIDIESYDQEKLTAALARLLNPLGGLARFIKPGMTVLLKPNLLSARTPDRAVTTHPELVAAVARKCLAAGASVLIGDSPGGVEKGLKRVWENTGMSRVAHETGATLVGFESGRVNEKSVEGRKYYLSSYAFDVDFIISLPKLKTHVLTNYTGAIKNCYGFIPGLRKADYHKQNPDARSFSRVVVDVYSLVKPGLCIMDGGMAMEGDGPASGEPRWLGYLFASTDGVALDNSVSSILGKKRRVVWPTEIALERGLGPADLSSIDRLGRAFRSGMTEDFKLPSNAYMNFIPSFLVKTLEPYLWVRPAINQDSCTLCMDCLTSCPKNAIYESDGRLEFNYDECIKCMCCHELCPSKSVFLERSRLGRLIGR
jgi:uncharacterized protein (DUF362 family)/Pyruvate/2-oxoacid:ferredoxin oxidoreductase delta subunit